MKLDSLIAIVVWGIICYRLGYKKGEETKEYEYERKIKYGKGNNNTKGA